MPSVGDRRSIPQTLDEWGPDCVRCGGAEYRIDGYCCVECRDFDELEREIERLGEAGDALADEATDLIGVVGEAGGCAPPLYEPLDAALATWHTATGGTTDA